MTFLEIEHAMFLEIQAFGAIHFMHFNSRNESNSCIRRSDKFWAGLGCALVIEQNLVRLLKCTGGLTRGSGMTEHQRAIWTMSSPMYPEDLYCSLVVHVSLQNSCMA